MKKVKTSIYLDSSSFEKIKKTAKEKDRSVNWVISRIIKDNLDK